MGRRRVDPEIVVSAALDVFAAKGFHEALISDIAAAADVSVGTVYNVARSKEALFLAVLKDDALDSCRCLSTASGGLPRRRSGLPAARPAAAR